MCTGLLQVLVQSHKAAVPSTWKDTLWYNTWSIPFHAAYNCLVVVHRTRMNPIGKALHSSSSFSDSMFSRAIVLFLIVTTSVNSFAPHGGRHRQIVRIKLADRGDWIGDVVSNNAGQIKGCKIQQVGESLTEWIIQVDG